MRLFLFICMFALGALHARDGEDLEVPEVHVLHVCSEEAFSALQICLEMPSQIGAWQNGHFYIENENLVVNRQGVFMVDRGKEIQIKGICYDDFNNTYLNVSFRKFWRECEHHLNDINDLPSGVEYALKLYVEGTKGV